MKNRVLLAICVAIALIAPRARAQSADALKKAQASFDQAQTDYVQGKYDEAAKGFQEAYAARPFPQFLYNVAASFHMKGKKASDLASYKQAVDYYKKYLAEEPSAADKPKVQKTIEVLEAEIKRIEDAAKSGSPTPPTAEASKEVQQLGDVKVRGLVVIETNVKNATIYLDDPKGKPFGQTPWSGELEGVHKVYFEKRGFQPADSTVSADPNKLVEVVVSMSQDTHQAWLDVTSNLEGASVFIDDHGVAPFKTPFPGKSMSPGKHTIWVTAEGYDEYQETVDIAAGQNYTIKATLKGSPVGKLDIIGVGMDESIVIIDGKIQCEHLGSCHKKLSEGEHQITITRPDYKPLTKKVIIEPHGETTVKPMLAKEPGRGDAVAAYIVTALFLGGGIYCGIQSKNIHDELNKAIMAGDPPVDNNDPRFLKGKIYAISADAGFGIALISGISALYYTFRENGPPSQAQIDTRAIAVTPAISPQYAGLDMQVRW
jgi:hypothetical protein